LDEEKHHQIVGDKAPTNTLPSSSFGWRDDQRIKNNECCKKFWYFSNWFKRST